MQDSSVQSEIDKGRRLILDGGLATQLEASGHNIDGALWSARLLQTNPDAIVDAHKAFLAAGADIITTASYQASRAGFHQLGVAALQADRLIASSVALARRACDELSADDARPRFVAASVGPYGAVLNDGSEYRGDYGVSDAILRDFHRQRLALLDGAGADVLAVETIPCVQETAVLAELLEEAKTPAWVSFCCRDGTSLADGSPIVAAATAACLCDNVFGIGVNCTAPQHVETLLAQLAAAVGDRILLAYPNSGETWIAAENSWTGTVDADQDFPSAAAKWLHQGAAIVGGCCRITPADIELLHRKLLN